MRLPAGDVSSFSYHLVQFFTPKPSGSFRQQPKYDAFASARVPNKSHSETDLANVQTAESIALSEMGCRHSRPGDVTRQMAVGEESSELGGIHHDEAAALRSRLTQFFASDADATRSLIQSRNKPQHSRTIGNHASQHRYSNLHSLMQLIDLR